MAIMAEVMNIKTMSVVTSAVPSLVKATQRTKTKPLTPKNVPARSK
jgi:hypothetical protein